MVEYKTLGKLDTRPLKNEFGDLQTDEIIVTNERLDHIKTHHADDYVYFKKYGTDAVLSPNEIIKDLKNDGTVFMIKYLPDTNLNVVVKLALNPDKIGWKNSVMTSFRIRERNLRKLRAKNKVLYNKE